MAKPVTPASRKLSATSGRVRGARNPTMVDSGFSRPISSAVGGFTFTTRSAGQGSPMVAPACSYCEWGSTPLCRRRFRRRRQGLRPCSRSTTLGASATPRSPQRFPAALRSASWDSCGVETHGSSGGRNRRVSLSVLGTPVKVGSVGRFRVCWPRFGPCMGRWTVVGVEVERPQRSEDERPRGRRGSAAY